MSDPDSFQVFCEAMDSNLVIGAAGCISSASTRPQSTTWRDGSVPTFGHLPIDGIAPSIGRLYSPAEVSDGETALSACSALGSPLSRPSVKKDVMVRIGSPIGAARARQLTDAGRQPLGISPLRSVPSWRSTSGPAPIPSFPTTTNGLQVFSFGSPAGANVGPHDSSPLHSSAHARVHTPRSTTSTSFGARAAATTTTGKRVVHVASRSQMEEVEWGGGSDEHAMTKACEGPSQSVGVRKRGRLGTQRDTDTKSQAAVASATGGVREGLRSHDCTIPSVPGVILPSWTTMDAVAVQPSNYLFFLELDDERAAAGTRSQRMEVNHASTTLLPTLSVWLTSFPSLSIHPSSSWTCTGEYIRALSWLGSRRQEGMLVAVMGQYLAVIRLPRRAMPPPVVRSMGGKSAPPAFPSTGTPGDGGHNSPLYEPVLVHEKWGAAATQESGMDTAVLRRGASSPGSGTRSVFLSPDDLRCVACNPFSVDQVATGGHDGTVTVLCLGAVAGAAGDARVITVYETHNRSVVSDCAFSPSVPGLLVWSCDGGAVQWVSVREPKRMRTAPHGLVHPSFLLTHQPALFALSFLDAHTLLLGYGGGGWQTLRLPAQCGSGTGGADQATLGPYVRDPAVPEIGAVLVAPAPTHDAASAASSWSSSASTTADASSLPAHTFVCTGSDGWSLWATDALQEAQYRNSSSSTHDVVPTASCIAQGAVSRAPSHASAHFTQMCVATNASNAAGMKRTSAHSDGIMPADFFPLRARVYAAWADSHTLVVCDSYGAVSVVDMAACMAASVGTGMGGFTGRSLASSIGGEGGPGGVASGAAYMMRQQLDASMAGNGHGHGQVFVRGSSMHQLLLGAPAGNSGQGRSGGFNTCIGHMGMGISAEDGGPNPLHALGHQRWIGMGHHPSNVVSGMHMLQTSAPGPLDSSLDSARHQTQGRHDAGFGLGIDSMASPAFALTGRTPGPRPVPPPADGAGMDDISMAMGSLSARERIGVNDWPGSTSYGGGGSAGALPSLVGPSGIGFGLGLSISAGSSLGLGLGMPLAGREDGVHTTST